MEGKVATSESEALNIYDQIKKEKERLDKIDDELQSLKNVNENCNSIIAKLEIEIELNNSIKKKEKEVYDVEKRNEGYQNTMKK